MTDKTFEQWKKRFWPLTDDEVWAIEDKSYEDVYYSDESCETKLSADIFAAKLADAILSRLAEKILAQHCGDSSGWDSAIEKVSFMLINKEG